MEIKDLKSVFGSCQAMGHIQFRKDIDTELARSLVDSALDSMGYAAGIEAVQKPGDSNAFLFATEYDILRSLIDAALLFDRLKCSNHQCSAAFLCEKHPEWELDWNTLEAMRLIRNAARYEGMRVTLDVWKSYELKFRLYISFLVNLVKEKIAESAGR